MKLFNLNTAWAKPGSCCGKRVNHILAKADADIVCLTEAFVGLLSETGHTIVCDDCTGYVYPDDRRKVILWSREPWMDFWNGADSLLPGGRFVTGISQGVRVVGVCIPWHMAHVTTGNRDRKPWEDHIIYLKYLTPILQQFLTRPEPLIVVGDWNQQIPQSGGTTKQAHTAMLQAIPVELEIVTQGEVENIGRRLIDHLAVSKDLKVDGFDYFGPRTHDGKPMSDHVGYSVEVGTRGAE